MQHVSHMFLIIVGQIECTIQHLLEGMKTPTGCVKNTIVLLVVVARCYIHYIVVVHHPRARWFRGRFGMDLLPIPTCRVGIMSVGAGVLCEPTNTQHVRQSPILRAPFGLHIGCRLAHEEVRWKIPSVGLGEHQ